MEKQEKINLIRNSIKENHYPLDYKGCIDYYGGNCYRYAIGSNYKENRRENDYIYNLGSISNSKPPTSIKDAKNAFFADMKVLGIFVKESKLEEDLKTDEWKVALFYDDYEKNSHDFHFARQDTDGSWSHQEFIDGPIRPLGKNPKFCTDLTLVGYYILRNVS